MASETVENYIKCIFSLQQETKGDGVATNAIAEHLQTKASSVTDMLKKLEKKGWADYKKYHGVKLTKAGKSEALQIVRRHRLWEVFLVDKLDFKWDEVHEMAEELEHVNYEELTSRLDAYLDHPRFDPHGDPIPDSKGEIQDHREKEALSLLQIGDAGVVIGVLDSSTEYLKYVDYLGLQLGQSLVVTEKIDFDNSMSVLIND
ncbi:MAG: metal-dependent transcriptional regulator, partial [Flavobacteriales bacterium]